MRVGRRESVERQARLSDRRAVQMKKNTVTVYPDGDVFSPDEGLRELVESSLRFSVPLGRFVYAPEERGGSHGFTVRYVG